MSFGKSIILLHTILASFFLPMGVMYAVTGGLYGLGFKGGYETAEHTIALDTPLPSDLAGLLTIVQRELDARQVPHPTGTAGVKKGGTSFFLEWTGTRRDIELHPTPDPLKATLRVKQTDPHRFFVQLHKAKGGQSFIWFAAVWMVGLVLLFVTGLALALAMPAWRKVSIPAALLGVAVFVGLAMIN